MFTYSYGQRLKTDEKQREPKRTRRDPKRTQENPRCFRHRNRLRARPNTLPRSSTTGHGYHVKRNDLKWPEVNRNDPTTGDGFHITRNDPKLSEVTRNEPTTGNGFSLCGSILFGIDVNQKALVSMCVHRCKSNVLLCFHRCNSKYTAFTMFPHMHINKHWFYCVFHRCKFDKHCISMCFHWCNNNTWHFIAFSMCKSKHSGFHECPSISIKQTSFTMFSIDVSQQKQWF